VLRSGLSGHGAGFRALILVATYAKSDSGESAHLARMIPQFAQSQ